MCSSEILETRFGGFIFKAQKSDMYELLKVMRLPRFAAIFVVEGDAHMFAENVFSMECPQQGGGGNSRVRPPPLHSLIPR